MEFLIPGTERVRKALEEIDTLQMAVVYEHALLAKLRSKREKLKAEHFIRSAIKRLQQIQGEMNSYISEKQDLLERERMEMKISEGKDLSVFYGMVKQVKEYHRRFPNEPADIHSTTRMIDELRVNEDQLEGMFSGEESLGRFLDLNQCFKLYLNMKSVQHIDYINYIRSFDVFEGFPMQAKLSNSYYNYLSLLLEYLCGFCERSLPLICLEESVFPEVQRNIESHIPDIPGWEEELSKVLSLAASPELYCPCCEKLFFNPNSFSSHLSGKSHHQRSLSHAVSTVEGASTLQELFEKSKSERLSKIKAIITLEYCIKALAKLVESIRKDTAANVERKQAMTSEELAAEETKDRDLSAQETAERQRRREQEEAEFIKEHMDGGVYNPLKLPLDWDGKPIPLWLWKLHGLGVKYPCEVCGNYVYLGRKAFDQHFFEWRHAHGMRCLGVPNTRHFFQITKIDQVLELWEKMKASVGSKDKGDVEELEDGQGNVYSRKTFEDMKRQGLL